MEVSLLRLLLLMMVHQVLLLLMVLNRSNAWWRSRCRSWSQTMLLLRDRLMDLGLDELIKERLGVDQDRGRNRRVIDWVVNGNILFLLNSRWLLLVDGLLWRANWWGSRWGEDAVVFVLGEDIVHDKVLLGELGSWSLNLTDLGSTGSESWALGDSALQLGNGDALARIHLEDETEDGIQLLRDWKDGTEEVWLLDESTEGAIRRVGTLPWVATASQVDEDDTQ